MTPGPRQCSDIERRHRPRNILRVSPFDSWRVRSMTKYASSQEAIIALLLCNYISGVQIYQGKIEREKQVSGACLWSLGPTIIAGAGDCQGKPWLCKRFPDSNVELMKSITINTRSYHVPGNAQREAVSFIFISPYASVDVLSDRAKAQRIHEGRYYWQHHSSDHCVCTTILFRWLPWPSFERGFPSQN